ncbi:hypothetical protein FOZ63_027899 [Perkinsus olseni]|uniref:Uncharacterized protein n=1 Tax=Perkinsus olseni TaxID=32597 RepID=A0A7J6R067_PEROL|nr:hypothetical protein FOZ63_027899 [Perkinsus olseni]KAF4713256.1 hypothetical protein FOZ62_023487 [Perkinsus olseni]
MLHRGGKHVRGFDTRRASNGNLVRVPQSPDIQISPEISLLAYFPSVVALKNSGPPADGVASEPYEGEYTVTYGAPSFLSMKATVNSDEKTIRIAFVCEHEVHDEELKYKVWGGGGRFSLDTKDGSVYYGHMIHKFAQLCPKFGNGREAVAPDLGHLDGDANFMETTVAGMRIFEWS